MDSFAWLVFCTLMLPAAYLSLGQRSDYLTNKNKMRWKYGGALHQGSILRGAEYYNSKDNVSLSSWDRPECLIVPLKDKELLDLDLCAFAAYIIHDDNRVSPIVGEMNDIPKEHFIVVGVTQKLFEIVMTEVTSFSGMMKLFSRVDTMNLNRSLIESTMSRSVVNCYAQDMRATIIQCGI